MPIITAKHRKPWTTEAFRNDLLKAMILNPGKRAMR